MTKHTGSSRSTDSGVSGNAQTSAREIRKAAEAAANALVRGRFSRDLKIGTRSSAYAVGMVNQAADIIETEFAECSRLASRVEELEKLIAKHSLSPELSSTQLDTTKEKV